MRVPSRIPLCLLAITLTRTGMAQQPVPAADAQARIQQLIERLTIAEAQIRELQQARATGGQLLPAAPTIAAVLPNTSPKTSPIPSPSPTLAAIDTDNDPHALMMEIPGGPALKIRGFFDFNYGVGPNANPLVFPVAPVVHNTFQAGEFDLFITSKLSNHFDFVSEVVLGPDQTNTFSVDIERYQLNYRQNEYFEISAGRYHSAIGYYNTAYHHGDWFQTATGRPFMYYFEDSGGLLPVHNVGVTANGLVPGTGAWGLHWTAEGGNGRSSSNTNEPVQNFLSDRSSKSYNFAFYIKPQWARGLQAGGSYYHDRLDPAAIPSVNQTIESAYAVFITPSLEFLNEAVLLTNRVEGENNRFRTPLMYTQVSKKFGIYRPYFRYQYVNSPAHDPVNIYTDRYQGPSVGLRIDLAAYVAFKLQYNRLDQRSGSSNGLDSQLAFTF